MGECACHGGVVRSSMQRRALRIALVLNMIMFAVGAVAAILSESSGLLADALDMLADAFAYGIALLAVGRGAPFKRRAALGSGALLALLGTGVLAEAIHHAVRGSEPQAPLMIGAAALSLAVNVFVLRSLRPYRNGDVHLRASWIFTRADVIANLGVILAGALVIGTGSRFPDVVTGGAIAVYVLREALEIQRSARAEGIRA